MPLPIVARPPRPCRRAVDRSRRRRSSATILGRDYVERFWLGVIGPSTTWLMRRLAAGLDRSTRGLHPRPAARPRGARHRRAWRHAGGRNSPFLRTLDRSCQFGARPLVAHDTLAVRRRLPPLNAAPGRAAARARCRRCTRRGRCPHARRPTPRPARARHLALSLVELGEPTTRCKRSSPLALRSRPVPRGRALGCTRREARRLAPDAARSDSDVRSSVDRPLLWRSADVVRRARRRTRARRRSVASRRRRRSSHGSTRPLRQRAYGVKRSSSSTIVRTPKPVPPRDTFAVVGLGQRRAGDVEVHPRDVRRRTP